MTAPVEHGYPDFGRFAARSDVLFFNLDVPDIDGSTNYGPVFVGSIQFLGVNAKPTVNNINLNFEYYADSALTVLLAIQTIDIQANTRFGMTIPVLGPWLLIRVVPSAINTTFTLKVWSAQGGALFMHNDARANSLIESLNAAVGAGATVTRDADKPWPGEAIWSINTALATWTARLVGLGNIPGVQRRLDTIDNTYPKNERRVFLTAQVAQIQFTNTTGAAGNFTCALIARPIWPGA